MTHKLWIPMSDMFSVAIFATVHFNGKSIQLIFILNTKTFRENSGQHDKAFCLPRNPWHESPPRLAMHKCDDTSTKQTKTINHSGTRIGRENPRSIFHCDDTSKLWFDQLASPPSSYINFHLIESSDTLELWKLSARHEKPRTSVSKYPITRKMSIISCSYKKVILKGETCLWVQEILKGKKIFHRFERKKKLIAF